MKDATVHMEMVFGLLAGVAALNNQVVEMAAEFHQDSEKEDDSVPVMEAQRQGFLYLMDQVRALGDIARFVGQYPNHQPWAAKRLSKAMAASTQVARKAEESKT